MNERSRLVLSLILAAIVAAGEYWGGYASRSLALTTDAVHVTTDVFALAVALIASIAARRRANRKKTFGYGRIEILGALLNGALLLAATGVLAFEAVRRFSEPVTPASTVMTLVAAGGLAVNLIIAFTLSHHGHQHHDHDHSHDLDSSLNVRAALYHVIGDALGAFAVICGGIAIALTHAPWIDPLLSLLVCAIIVWGVFAVVRDAADVLLESAPRGIDSGAVEATLRSTGGVAAVHDLHVWSIASHERALSAHVLLDEGRIHDASAILAEMRDILRSRYDISHVTVQLESEHCDPGGIVICVPEELL